MNVGINNVDLTLVVDSNMLLKYERCSNMNEYAVQIRCSDMNVGINNVDSTLNRC